jgi:Tfp pilus assembly protein PilX
VSRADRGYALLLVLVGVVVLSALGTAFLSATARDRSEANVQRDSSRATYAAEGSVVWGTAKLHELLRGNPAPTAAELLEIGPPTMQGVEFPRDEFRVEFVSTPPRSSRR